MATRLAFIFLLIYTQLTGVISSIFVEISGVYITEIGGAVENKGASLSYILVVLLTIVFFLLGSIKINDLLKRGNNFRKPSQREIKIYLWLVSLFLGFLLLHVLISGSPYFNSEITRFNFWTSYAKIPVISVFPGVLALPLILILGIIKANDEYHNILSRPQKSFLNLLIALYFAYLYLLGHKFNGFIVALTAFFPAIIFIRQKMRVSLIKRNEYIGIALILAFAVYLTYVFFNKSEGGVIDAAGSNPIIAVLYRMLVLQGYAWPAIWAQADSCTISENVSLMHNAINLLAYSPSFFLENGINLANIFPAILLCAPYGFIFLIAATSLIGLFLGILVYWGARLISKGSILRSAILLQALITSIASFSSGDYGIEFLFKIFIPITAVFLLTLIRYSLSSRNGKFVYS